MTEFEDAVIKLLREQKAELSRLVTVTTELVSVVRAAHSLPTISREDRQWVQEARQELLPI